VGVFTLACKLIVFQGYDHKGGIEGDSVMIDDGNMYTMGDGWGLGIIIIIICLLIWAI
jgi:hypothetical protein